MGEDRLERWMRAERMVEVHRAAAGQHEDVAQALHGEALGHPGGEFHRSHGFHPFQSAVRRIASSRPIVALTPSCSRIRSVEGT
jgi:hypothetical protein